MLNLTNLTLVLSKPSTLYINNKQIKISSATTTVCTHSIPRSSGQGQIHWDDVLTLPTTNELNFQITTKHQFGYNPEELETVIQGKIKINENPKDKQPKSITTTVTNLQGQKIGYLKIVIKASSRINAMQTNRSTTSQLIVPKSQIQKIINPQEQITMNSPLEKSALKESLVITSVIAHIDSIKGQQVQLKFKWSKNQTNSEAFKSKSGEIVYIGNYKIENTSNQNQRDTQLSVQLLQYTSSSIIANAVFLVDSQGNLSKKGSLKDSQGKQLGQMFIEGKITTKSSKNNAKSLIDILQNSPKDISSSSFLKKPVQRKRSIINHNKDLIFAKQVRFFGNLHDKKNQNVTYQQQNRGSLDFRQALNNKFYRGASIGRGSKHDFTANGSGKPGVGEYFLPSIWDRY